MLGGRRILIFTSVFARSPREAWLVDDLVDSLLRAGNLVDVVVADTTRPRPRGLQPETSAGLRVLSVGPHFEVRSAPAKLVAYLLSGLGLWWTARRWTRRETYDLGLYTSIACFTWGVPGHLRRSGVVRRLTLVLWDFFPVHQLEIGRIRARWAAGLMKATEAAAIRSADVVALMSPANVAFFRRYFPGVNARTVVVPPWSSSGDEPVGAAHPDGDRLRVMFGGQLVRGRGVETIVDAAALLREDPIDILIAGDGPEREGLEHRAAGIDGIEFLGMLARADYRALLRTVDVGVAVTVGGVSVPSFPSKIVEYCGLGVPVVVAVEPTSDAGAMVESRGAGLVIPVDDAPALASALRALRSEQVDGALARRARSARKLYDDELSADAAATRLVESSLDGAGLPGALPR